MPRQSRGRSSSSSRTAPAQTRSAHTAAAPAGYAQARAPAPAPPAAAAAATGTEKAPGMMAQMAATAGSVAIGSTIGHGLSNMFKICCSAAEVRPPSRRPLLSSRSNSRPTSRNLEKADMPSCTYYLEQLKACQAAAAPY
ncbi:hypothetical protein GGX14DRAFT_666677 [Mycena pura]|uniref:CHCH domain-containing protein n=1 Tax=Mycena pura TaxID=153505 RepID=A0AAD6V321_9AGAR|nr:hypothetical protein GGX14DRAFT_666677 [Mycena pura]